MGFREHTGLQLHDVEDGIARVGLDAGNDHLNAHGSVHGGVLATLLDAAMSEAVQAAGRDVPVTVSLTVAYLEPGRPGRLEATARVRKRGRRLLVVEGEVVQDGDVLADALATFAAKERD